MTDTYRWTSTKPLNRDDPIEQGQEFEPTDAEVRAYRDLMRPVDDQDNSEGDNEDGDEERDLEAVLDGTVVDLKEELATGEYDDVLDELDELESDGENRDTAHDAIDARREE